MKIKISHLVKTTAILTGLGFFFLAESAEAQLRISRSSNVPSFGFSVFDSPDSTPNNATRGRFIGAIQDISYSDSCDSESTITAGFLCSPVIAAEYSSFFNVNIPQANLLANLKGDVIKYTFKVNSSFIDVDGRTYLPNNFYKFEVNLVDLVNLGLDPTRAVNDLNYIIDNNVLALVDFDSEMLSVIRDDGTTIRLDSPSFDSLNSDCFADDGTESELIIRGQDENGNPVGICSSRLSDVTVPESDTLTGLLVVDDPGETAIPEPSTIAGLLVLANSPILAGLGRFLRTKSNQK